MTVTLVILGLFGVGFLVLSVAATMGQNKRNEEYRKSVIDKIHMDTIKQNIERREKELERHKELDAKAKEIELEKNSRIDSAGTVSGSIDVLSDLSARGRNRVQRSSTTGD